MKRFLVLLFSLLIVVSLSACGGGKEKDEPSTPPEDVTNTTAPAAEEKAPEEEPEEEKKEEEKEEEEPPAPEITAYSLQGAAGFGGGWASINFRDDANGVYCAGIIDNKGKLQHYVAGSVYSATDNKNGYIYGEMDQTFFVVTPKGKVTSYPLSNEVRRECFGDGYVVMREYKAGFDAVEYIYHFYDDSGKELTTYSSGKDTISINYVGEGTFIIWDNKLQNDEINAYGYYSRCANLFFAKSNTWHKNVVLSDTGGAINNYSYCDGVFMIRGATQNGNTNTHPGEFTYMNDQGAVQTLTVPAEYGTQPRYLKHTDGLMLFCDTYTRQVYSYDVKAKSWSNYQGKYTEQMTSDYNYFVTGDGCAAIILRGADNKYYTMLLDKSMKDMLDAPILGTPAAIRDGVLYINDSNNGKLCCYDLKGKQIGEIPNVDFYRNQFEEGIIVTNQNEFLKPDGTPAFEVSYSGGKQITLSK